MRNKLFLVYVNISLVCVLLLGLELAGQFAYYVWKGYPVYESDEHLITNTDERLTELHPFLVGRLASNRRATHDGRVVTTTELHTRWTGAGPADSGDLRVAVVGGSTTFGAGVTDSASWPARLQAILGPGYAVTNYGMLGYSSAEAVIQTALLVPEGRPDVVVFYEGWNDLHNFHDSALGPDYYSHGLQQFSNLDIERPQPTGLFAKLAEVSAICRLASVAGRRLVPRDRSAGPGPMELTSAPESGPDLFVERIYRRNLGTMRILAQQAGAYALFVPQVLDESRFSGEGSSWWTPHVRNRAMPALLRRMNDILAGSCGADRARCAVLDVTTARAWEPEDFIDEGHFSPTGNDAFAQLIAAWVTGAVARHVIPAGRATGY